MRSHSLASALAPPRRNLQAIVLVLSLLLAPAGCTVPNPAAGTPVDFGAVGDGPVVLAEPGDKAQSGPVDGISCETSEQLLFHIHAHLAMFVAGQEKLVPPGIGIGAPLSFSGGFVVGGSCYSWLHTHDASGIIHIESPVQRVFTVGNLFDIWGQPLSATQVGPARGTVTAFVDGQPFKGDPTTIPMNDHGVIQLDVGTPATAAQPYTFPAGL